MKPSSLRRRTANLMATSDLIYDRVEDHRVAIAMKDIGGYLAAVINHMCDLQDKVDNQAITIHQLQEKLKEEKHERPVAGGDPAVGKGEELEQA